MSLKNLALWILGKIPDSFFEELSKPTFAETDGMAQVQILVNTDETRGRGHIQKTNKVNIEH
ncbi:hypothetical protein AB6849_26790 [Serratia proteamaculans]|uniref:hypothetical protein n=1 Tax=Serratia proteamaculans TaxID=28151 RepID=UPI001C59FD38|nr:hypothetical protein [Serratia proteamaculans]WEO89986.1 hypothetical protein JET59_001775 [Serratia proteamaculans]